MKTDKELKQLAKDIYSRNVFTDRHIKTHDKYMLPMIFMPLAMLSSESKTGKNFADSEPAMIYEYMDKAGPNSINGYPTFMSMASINKEEMEKLGIFYDKIVDAMNGI